jgi:hypothetical protein
MKTKITIADHLSCGYDNCKTLTPCPNCGRYKSHGKVTIHCESKGIYTATSEKLKEKHICCSNGVACQSSDGYVCSLCETPWPNDNKAPLIKNKTFTFDELVEYGRENHLGVEHNNMPWSFNINNYPISHETDTCYLIGNEGLRMEPGGLVVIGENGELKGVWSAKEWHEIKMEG